MSLRRIGPFLMLILLAVVPVLLWGFYNFDLEIFTNPSLSFLTLGKLFGLFGFALFATNTILAARIKLLNRFFSGLDIVYKHHHKIGSLSFMFVLFHPLLLSLQYLPLSIKQTLIFLVPDLANLPVFLGITAFLGLMLLIVLTIYLPPSYRIWRWTHKFMGLFFSFAVLHVFLVPSDVSRLLPLKIYMFALVGLSLASILYRTIFREFQKSKVPYEVRSVKKINEQVTQINISPLGEGIGKHIPGQFIFISFEDGEVGKEEHPFSLTSKSGEKDLQISVKNLGDYTKNIFKVKPGTKAFVEGPYGNFSFENFALRDQIWIAGGIGITPFVSMAKSLQKSDRLPSIELFYAVRNEAEAVYSDELKSMEKEKFKVTPVFSEKEGWLTAEKIAERTNLWNREILICGPIGMMRNFKNQFLKMGIRRNRIHFEEFSLLS